MNIIDRDKSKDQLSDDLENYCKRSRVKNTSSGF